MVFSNKKKPYLTYNINVTSTRLNIPKLSDYQVSLYQKICDLRFDGNLTWKQVADSLNDLLIPLKFNINSIYPNPFNPITNISLSVPQYGQVTVKVYNLNGKIIATIQDENMNPGYYNIKWDASNYPSGIYLLQMMSEGFIKTQKVVLMK